MIRVPVYSFPFSLSISSLTSGDISARIFFQCLIICCRLDFSFRLFFLREVITFDRFSSLTFNSNSCIASITGLLAVFKRLFLILVFVFESHRVRIRVRFAETNAETPERIIF